MNKFLFIIVLLVINSIDQNQGEDITNLLFLDLFVQRGEEKFPAAIITSASALTTDDVKETDSIKLCTLTKQAEQPICYQIVRLHSLPSAKAMLIVAKNFPDLRSLLMGSMPKLENCKAVSFQHDPIPISLTSLDLVCSKCQRLDMVICGNSMLVGVLIDGKKFATYQELLVEIKEVISCEEDYLFLFQDDDEARMESVGRSSSVQSHVYMAYDYVFAITFLLLFIYVLYIFY